MLWSAAAAVQNEDESRGRPVDVKGGWKAVWLSDLHEASDVKAGWFNPKRWVRGAMYASANRLTEYFQWQNLKEIAERIKSLRPAHILVTGDLTNLATPAQFKKVKDLFLELQSDLGNESKGLDRELWTIIPGNHDVRWQATRFENRKHFGTFLEYFGELYADEKATSVLDPFPYENEQFLVTPKTKLRLICLDSNTHWPVWVVGPNAKGKIDNHQMDQLKSKLANAGDREIRLVVLHHHPVTVPKIVSNLENYFLSLDAEDSRNLIAACAAESVAAILHGHFHAYSDWSIPIVKDGTRRMSVIGAPCGTMGAPGVDVAFLELRESLRSTPKGVELGLAVYSHRQSESQWQHGEYLTFISSGIIG
jgi:3',5'-cyclic AMP phosphodiesterase CpdA